MDSTGTSYTSAVDTAGLAATSADSTLPKGHRRSSSSSATDGASAVTESSSSTGDLASSSNSTTSSAGDVATTTSSTTNNGGGGGAPSAVTDAGTPAAPGAPSTAQFTVYIHPSSSASPAAPVNTGIGTGSSGTTLGNPAQVAPQPEPVPSVAPRPATTAAPDSGASSALNAGALAGGVAGGVVALTLALILLFFAIRKRRQQPQVAEPTEEYIKGYDDPPSRLSHTGGRMTRTPSPAADDFSPPPLGARVLPISPPRPLSPTRERARSPLPPGAAAPTSTPATWPPTAPVPVSDEGHGGMRATTPESPLARRQHLVPPSTRTASPVHRSLTRRPATAPARDLPLPSPPPTGPLPLPPSSPPLRSKRPATAPNARAAPSAFGYSAAALTGPPAPGSPESLATSRVSAASPLSVATSLPVGVDSPPPNSPELPAVYSPTWRNSDLAAISQWLDQRL